MLETVNKNQHLHPLKKLATKIVRKLTISVTSPLSLGCWAPQVSKLTAVVVTDFQSLKLPLRRIAPAEAVQVTSSVATVRLHNGDDHSYVILCPHAFQLVKREAL